VAVAMHCKGMQTSRKSVCP